MCAKYNQGERSSPDEITLYTLFRVSSDQLKCQEIVSIGKSKSNQIHHFAKNIRYRIHESHFTIRYFTKCDVANTSENLYMGSNVTSAMISEAPFQIYRLKSPANVRESTKNQNKWKWIWIKFRVDM